MTSTTSSKAANVTLREVQPRDIQDCARIVFEAFGDIHDHHRFQRDFPTLEAATAMMEAWIPHPRCGAWSPRSDGEIVGSNFLDERDPIRASGRSRSTPRDRTAASGAG